MAQSKGKRGHYIQREGENGTESRTWVAALLSSPENLRKACIWPLTSGNEKRGRSRSYMARRTM